MEDFRIIVRPDHEVGAQVANLITATGKLRDEIGTKAALGMLRALRDEIKFCERYILNADNALAR